MSTRKWIEHLEASVVRRRDFDFGAGPRSDDEATAAVLSSLQTFQRGLSSPGNDLRTKVRRSCDADYARAVDLYVQEKHVHAELLAQLLWASGSRPGSRPVSDFVFRRLRRRFDWAPELMILLAAEMASMPYFRAVASTLDDPLICGVLDSILADQAWHLGFHIDHLRPALAERSGQERLALQYAWGAFFTGTLGVVLAENRTVFEALDYSRLTYWTDAWNLFAQVQSGLYGSQYHAAVLARDPRLRFVV